MSRFLSTKFLFIIISYCYVFLSFSNAEIVKKIIINGNDRISDETILVFSSIKVGDDINNNELNQITKSLYETNFFDNISVIFEKDEIIIQVKESPIINIVKFQGIKSETLNKLRFSRGLKYFLFGFQHSQNEIKNFVNKCMKSEDKNGYLCQNFYKLKINTSYKFTTGPFVDKIFKIIDLQKNKIEIYLGNIKTSIQKQDFLFKPI